MPAFNSEAFYESSYATDYVNEPNINEKYSRACELLNNCARVLDLGCGDGSFGAMLRQLSSNAEIYGVDISEKAVSVACEKGVKAYQLDIGSEKLPFPEDFFDGIFCGEVIEHVYDPDHLLDEIYRVLQTGKLCVLTTPNLASWFNRLLLLLGYQPLFTEVSTRYGVGHPFPFWLRAGHIRVFALKALTELVTLHNFKIVQIVGFGINTRLGYGKRWSVMAKIANKVFSRPSLSSDIMLMMTK